MRQPHACDQKIFIFVEFKPYNTHFKTLKSNLTLKIPTLILILPSPEVYFNILAIDFSP